MEDKKYIVLQHKVHRNATWRDYNPDADYSAFDIILKTDNPQEALGSCVQINNPDIVLGCLIREKFL
jgi:hypothetical protein